MGKGDARRLGDNRRFGETYDKIFGKKTTAGVDPAEGEDVTAEVHYVGNVAISGRAKVVDQSEDA